MKLPRDSSVGRAVDCSVTIVSYPSVTGSIPVREKGTLFAPLRKELIATSGGPPDI
jgi:hypothetical protein